MTRWSLFVICVVALLRTGSVEAQHHYQHPLGYRVGGPMFLGAYLPQPVQVVSYPVSPVPVFFPYPASTSKSNVTPSTPAARLKSLDLQARGDQRMREQKWSEARAAYSSSIAAASDRAEGHLRLGLCYVAIQRYDWAIREIKRAITLDPKTSRTAEKLEILFGPDSKIIRNSIVGKLGDWAREDMNDPDRLFLYGVILQFNDDPRGHEMLETALQKKTGGDVAHITMFLKGDETELALNGFPMPNNRRVSQLMAKPNFDLRFPNPPSRPLDGPVPMPDGPELIVDAPVPMP